MLMHLTVRIQRDVVLPHPAPPALLRYGARPRGCTTGLTAPRGVGGRLGAEELREVLAKVASDAIFERECCVRLFVRDGAEANFGR